MARFGKKAELPQHKSTQNVECIISVSEDNCHIDPGTGEVSRYYVEAQRLQDDVSPEDAMSGKADSNPYITNKKEYYKTVNGELKEKTSHQESISAYGMEQIKKAAVNEFDTIRKVFDSVTGEERDKIVHNYIVKVNIGFDGRTNSAFFYVPKASNESARDEAYSFRNMPKAGRLLTQQIIDAHNQITQLAKEAAQKQYGFGKKKADVSQKDEPEIINNGDETDEPSV